LSQYFKNVEVSDSKDGLFIFYIYILELKPFALRNAPSFGVDFTVTVTQKGNRNETKNNKRLGENL
jgi:hypothetical protein